MSVNNTIRNCCIALLYGSAMTNLCPSASFVVILRLSSDGNVRAEVHSFRRTEVRAWHVIHV